MAEALKLRRRKSDPQPTFTDQPSISGPESVSWLTVQHIMSTNVASIPPHSTVVAAAKTMSSENLSYAVVCDNGSPVGIITETDFLTKGVAGSDFRRMTVEQIMTSPVRSVPPDLSVMEAGFIMEAEDITLLLVLEKGQAVGIVTQTDVLQVTASGCLCKQIWQIMNPGVAAITNSATVREATQLMASKCIPCVAAVAGGQVTGVFTERDLLTRVVALKRNPARTKLKSVMTSAVATVHSDCSVLNAWRVLERAEICHLVVVDNQAVVGVVTQTDILRAIEAQLHEEQKESSGQVNADDDGILVVNEKGRPVAVNARFAEIWGIPDELIREQDFEKLTRYIACESASGGELLAFFAKMQARCLAFEESSDTLGLKNGKVLKVCSVPLVRENAEAGRVWSFRDCQVGLVPGALAIPGGT